MLTENRLNVKLKIGSNHLITKNDKEIIICFFNNDRFDRVCEKHRSNNRQRKRSSFNEY